jgi:NAD(P)-dependent dehydrogenase (short-subunit alcohol dehydrogenase family)
MFGRMEHLEGKVAVVTGGASGIGLAIVESFVAEGMRVVMTDIDEDTLMSVAARLSDSGADVHPTHADVSDPDAVDRVGQDVLERYGQLHVAVNNAGVVNRGNTWELTLEEWHRVIDTNLWGVINCIRSFVPLILATGEEGHVVTTGSMASVLPVSRLGPYTVAKHGVLGLSDVLRLEFEAVGAPIGVSVVLPGMIRTSMNPIGTTEPSRVAANVVDAIRTRRAYVFTDPDGTAEVEARLNAIIRARHDVCE